jgi:catechol 2,3-dioxygenase-like lactoylglutathione lyase family enzyme
MSIIKAQDIEYVRFGAPDLARMRRFLLDFGMIEVDQQRPGVLRMRGTGDAPFVSEIVEGEPGFRALALRAASIGDLKRLADAEGAPIEYPAELGGAARLILKDPNGYQVEVIAGGARAPSRPHHVRGSWNTMARRGRPGVPKRVSAGPASVVRLGHVVLIVNDTRQSWEWWQSRFGLLMSDEVRAPNGDLVAVFIRCDRGADPADHHTLNFAALPGMAARFHHAAFEVADLDDLMAGHEHLKQAGYQQDWGVGRHILGSQVFDYWKDPWGYRVEHWTDGDQFAADVPKSVVDLPTLLGRQWGPEAPPDFV